MNDNFRPSNNVLDTEGHLVSRSSLSTPDPSVVDSGDRSRSSGYAATPLDGFQVDGISTTPHSNLPPVDPGQSPFNYASGPYYFNPMQDAPTDWAQVSATNPGHAEGGHFTVPPSSLKSSTSPGSNETSPREPVPSPEASKEQLRRQANALAARNYRKRGGKVAKLEQQLREKTAENDKLKYRLASTEGENRILREMLYDATGRRMSFPGN